MARDCLKAYHLFWSDAVPVCEDEGGDMGFKLKGFSKRSEGDENTLRVAFHSRPKGFDGEASKSSKRWSYELGKYVDLANGPGAQADLESADLESAAALTKSAEALTAEPGAEEKKKKWKRGRLTLKAKAERTESKREKILRPEEPWRKKQARLIEEKFMKQAREREGEELVVVVEEEEEEQPFQVQDEWLSMERRVSNRKPRTLEEAKGKVGRMNVKKTDEDEWLAAGVYGEMPGKNE